MKRYFLLTILIATSLFAKYEKTVNEDFVSYKFEAKYSNVLFTLADEIEQNGFIISYRAKIARALKKYDKHHNQEPIFRKAQKIGFCKLSLTSKMMEENPNNLLFCPLSLAIYEKNGEKNKITILYRFSRSLKKDEKVMEEVNKEVIKLIENSIEEY